MTNLKIFLIEHWYPRGKNDTDLSRAIGVDQSIVSRWVNGVSEPSLDRKIQISKIIGVDSRQLFPEEK